MKGSVQNIQIAVSSNGNRYYRTAIITRFNPLMLGPVNLRQLGSNDVFIHGLHFGRVYRIQTKESRALLGSSVHTSTALQIRLHKSDTMAPAIVPKAL